MISYPAPQLLVYKKESQHALQIVTEGSIPLRVYREIGVISTFMKKELDTVRSSIKISLGAPLPKIYTLLDAGLWWKASPYAEQISKILGIEDIEEIEPESRYKFFVETLKVSTKEGQLYEQSPSGLEILMGAESFEPVSGDKAKDRISSGDILYDNIAAIMLAFPEGANAGYLIDNFGLASALAVCAQVGEIRQKQIDEAENGKKGQRRSLEETLKTAYIGSLSLIKEDNVPQVEKEAMESIGVKMPSFD